MRPCIEDGRIRVSHVVRVDGKAVRFTGWIYDEESASKHGIKWTHWKDPSVQKGDYILFDDGYICNIWKIYDAGNGNRLIATSAGACHTAEKKYSIYPFQYNMYKIREYKHLIDGNIHSDKTLIWVYDQYIRDGRSLEEVYEELVPNNYMGTAKGHAGYIAWVDRLLSNRGMEMAVEEKLKQEMQMQVERSLENINETINSALDEVGLNAQAIAARLADIVNDENPKVALEAIKEINKLRNMYPSKTRITESGRQDRLRITGNERKAIQDALGEE